MSLAPGTRLGPYEVTGHLDSGGMGEVYRARDTRLGRTVALKVLHDALAGDATARARFEREARAAATLAHPNICAIHDVGVAPLEGRGDVQYLVMELVDGEPLTARIARGALPLEDVLTIGRQMLQALVAAHRAGLVHRDLKPGNVMLTKTGAKLLDFGLAKPSGVSASSREPETESTRAAQPITGPASLLGTPQYMAPEQLEGREADARVDLWAVGIVLYEMLTGLRPFTGDSTASLVGAILKDQPVPLGTRRQLTPPALEHVVTRALAKDADERWQTARDMLDALEHGGQVATTAAAGAAPSKAPRARWPWLGVGALGGAVAAALALSERAVQPVDAATPVTIDLPRPLAFRSVGQIVGDVGLWMPSPDGRWLLGIEALGDGRWQFVLRDVTKGTTQTFPSSAGNVRVANAGWAEDSSAIAYFDARDGGIKRLSIGTGQVKSLATARDCRGVAWSGAVIVWADNQPIDSNLTAFATNLRAVDAGSGAPVTLDVSDTRGSFPTPLGGGRFLLRRGAGDTGVVGQGLAPAVAVPGGNSSVFAAGHVFYLRQGQLVAQRYDVGSNTLGADVTPLVDQALADVATGPHARASSRVVTAVVGESPFRGTWVSRQGRTEPTPAILGYNGSFTSRLWQGRLLATSLIDAASNNPDIWTIDLVTGSRQRVFQSPETWDSHPRWSQDGESLLFRSGTRILIAKPGLGDAGPRVVAEDIPGLERVDDWSPDGRTALVSVNRGRTLMDIQAVDVATGLTHPFVASDANESFAMFSPDGTRVAYATDGSGTSEVYVQAFPSGATRRVSTAGGALPRWSADGRRLYFLSPAGWLMQSTVNGTRSDVTVSTPEPVVQATGIDFIPSSDDSRFLVFERDPQPRSIAIVNWPSLLPKHP